ncbi:hypothetical protein PsYK624_062180 [Phanerochaete sordida]|uniref:Uncharacterized protein n=1 Tax=Phanerochaete sordida TaxID=48140 RepID=A0A9P3G8Y0_9APHY|nr:hypothetical protein PsYK624_062180 [Phanerochaete sordida]
MLSTRADSSLRMFQPSRFAQRTQFVYDCSRHAVTVRTLLEATTAPGKDALVLEPYMVLWRTRGTTHLCSRR